MGLAPSVGQTGVRNKISEHDLVVDSTVGRIEREIEVYFLLKDISHLEVGSYF